MIGSTVYGVSVEQDAGRPGDPKYRWRMDDHGNSYLNSSYGTFHVRTEVIEP